MKQKLEGMSKVNGVNYLSKIEGQPLQNPVDQIGPVALNPGKIFSTESKLKNYQQFILPSYQMHEAVVSKSAVVEATKPVPSYEEIASPTFTYSNETVDRLLNSPILEALDSDVLSQDSCYKQDYSHVVLDEGISQDFNNLRSKLRSPSPKILDIHHDLEPLEASSNIELSVHFTKEPGEIGTKPQLIDPSNQEFSPGDNIYGYWIAENTSNTGITFDTFYTLLEGNIVYGIPGDPNTSIITFLQALDFEACSCVVKSPTEILRDSTDNSFVGYLKGNSLHPGVRYKRFFQFKLPEYILDSKNGETANTQPLPPSMGPSGMDLTFLNFKIAYNVGVKFITIDNHANKYTSLRSSSRALRVIPRKQDVSEMERNANEQLAIESKDRFLSRLDKCIQRIKDLRESPSPESQNQASKHSNEKNQAYVGYSQRSEGLEDLTSMVHDIELRTEKKQFGHVRMQGRLSILISTETKIVKYIAPKKFRTGPPSKETIGSWNISIPIQMTYQPMNERNRLPEMIHVEASLVSFSFATLARSFPLELCHSMIYNNDTGKNFNDIILGPVREKMTNLRDQLKKLRSHQLVALEKSLFEDAKCINRVRTKLNILDVVDVGVGLTSKLKSSLISWSKQKGSCEDTYTKEMVIRVNLAKAVERRTNTMNVEVPTYERFCLVPDFQIGNTGRFYFLKLCMVFMDGSEATSRIPVRVVKE